MGAKYPILTPQEIIRVLQTFGFVNKTQKGSHAKYIKTEKGKPTRTVIIPMHNEVAKGTLKSILEQAGLTLDEFIKKL